MEKTKKKNIICFLFGHKAKSHLDLIYGSLLREHKECERCDKSISFEQCSRERADELPLIDCF